MTRGSLGGGILWHYKDKEIKKLRADKQQLERMLASSAARFKPAEKKAVTGHKLSNALAKEGRKKKALDKANDAVEAARLALEEAQQAAKAASKPVSQSAGAPIFLKCMVFVSFFGKTQWKPLPPGRDS